MADIESRAGTPEEIAYRLYRDIAILEKSDGAKDREWVLATYADCIEAVRSGADDYNAGQKRHPGK